jgi:N-acetylneuraminate synthase
MKDKPLQFNPFPQKTYFIADIAANHDGSLDRAKKLIHEAAAAGADAAKFQNFRAETIVSNRGFRDLGSKLSHQKNWTKDVVEVYREAELPSEWTSELIAACEEAGVDYFTAPYDLEFIDFFKDKMPFYKVGSGDITFLEGLQSMAKTGLPVLLATGASDLEEVEQAIGVFKNTKNPLVIMQCNTNYTGSDLNFNYLNLSVLTEYKNRFPNCGLGLSDHTPGHVAVLGAVALGARYIEKHFTDDKKRTGPDHSFSLDAVDWKCMVDDTRILESAMGDGVKRVEKNEEEAQIVQRRALRFGRNFSAGHTISRSDLIALRPIPKDGISPMRINEILGKRLSKAVDFDELVTFDHFND